MILEFLIVVIVVSICGPKLLKRVSQSKQKKFIKFCVYNLPTDTLLKLGVLNIGTRRNTTLFPISGTSLSSVYASGRSFFISSFSETQRENGIQVWYKREYNMFAYFPHLCRSLQTLPNSWPVQVRKKAPSTRVRLTLLLDQTQ